MKSSIFLPSALFRMRPISDFMGSAVGEGPAGGRGRGFGGLPAVVRAVVFGYGVLGGAMVGEAGEYVGDGEPTAREEEVRWILNRGRFDVVQENALRKTAYSDVAARGGPMAPHASLLLASRHHSEDMAAKNVMQHQTVTGSAYYDPVKIPDPWDRAQAEGYPSGWVFENVAAGYATVEQVYLGWWKSTGHRQNMYRADLREIGIGYGFRTGTTYLHYWTMNPASAGGAAFFTDTAFHDANGNGAYNQGEGVAGLVVRLKIGNQDSPDWDSSTPVGSFAVPLGPIPAGSLVRVVLHNGGNQPVTLSVPKNFSTLEPVILQPGDSREHGTFIQSSTDSNFGFRDLSPAPVSPPPVPVPALTLAVVGSNVRISWSSATGWMYRPQSSDDGRTWANATAVALAGTGETLVYTEQGALNARRQTLYRVVVEEAP